MCRENVHVCIYACDRPVGRGVWGGGGGWKNPSFLGNLEIFGREAPLFCICNL